MTGGQTNHSLPVRLIALGALSAFFLTVSPLQARVIHVPADSATIQAGIDGASPGDTVEIAADTYSGEGNRDLVIGGKPILIRSNIMENSTIDHKKGNLVTNDEKKHDLPGPDSR